MNQPARLRPLHQKRSARVVELVRPDHHPHGQAEPPSAPVRPDLVSQVEHFADIARELPSLFERHYREIALDQESIPLDPDWDRYFMLAMQGMLIVRTARFDKTLVGYIFNLIGPHLHYRSTPHAEIEMFWLDPAYRGSSFTLRWFRENEAALKELGIRKVGVATKNGYKDGRVGLIFKRLGYRPVETIWSRVL